MSTKRRIKRAGLSSQPDWPERLQWTNPGWNQWVQPGKFLDFLAEQPELADRPDLLQKLQERTAFLLFSRVQIPYELVEQVQKWLWNNVNEEHMYLNRTNKLLFTKLYDYYRHHPDFREWNEKQQIYGAAYGAYILDKALRGTFTPEETEGILRALYPLICQTRVSLKDLLLAFGEAGQIERLRGHSREEIQASLQKENFFGKPSPATVKLYNRFARANGLPLMADSTSGDITPRQIIALVPETI